MDTHVLAQDELVVEGDERSERRSEHRTMAGIFSIPDEMWERVEPLIPEHVNPHPVGGGRPRVPDRQVIDGIFFVLRTGCQWRALDGTGIVNGATAHRRFQEWEQAGFFEALWEQALRDYEDDVGIDWSWMSIDGSMGKARWEAGKPAGTRPIAASSGSSAA
jgi:transposase